MSVSDWCTYLLVFFLCVHVCVCVHVSARECVCISDYMYIICMRGHAICMVKQCVMIELWIKRWPSDKLLNYAQTVAHLL